MLLFSITKSLLVSSGRLTIKGLLLTPRRGFEFEISDFEVLFKRELSELSPELKSKVLSASPQHWSWAFRQISSWRAMLMDGAGDGQS